LGMGARAPDGTFGDACSVTVERRRKVHPYPSIWDHSYPSTSTWPDERADTGHRRGTFATIARVSCLRAEVHVGDAVVVGLANSDRQLDGRRPVAEQAWSRPPRQRVQAQM
jgi:hypothetical protein